MIRTPRGDRPPRASGFTSLCGISSRRSVPVTGSERRSCRWIGPIASCLHAPSSLCWRELLFGSHGMPEHPERGPPGKPYQTTSGAPPTVGFSNEPHPSTATGMAGLYGNKGPGALVSDGDRTSTTPGDNGTYGTPAPGTANLGAPTDNKLRRPGTAGTNDSVLGHGRTRQFAAEVDAPVDRRSSKGPGGDSRLGGPRRRLSLIALISLPVERRPEGRDES